MTILVFGSINMDFVAQVPHLPKAGETVLGHQFFTMAGGKGANQAVAVARLGGDCQMVGRVGEDPFGVTLVQQLRDAGVDCDTVRTDATTSSGAAVIEVSAGGLGSEDQPGDNHIVVIPGANGQMDDSDIARLELLLPQASWLLLQLEVPLPAVLAAARAAHRRGVSVMLDPAPAQPLPDELYGYITVLTPNQTEAEQLTGLTIAEPSDAAAAATWLRRRGVSTVVITLGPQGALYQSATESSLVPTFTVEAVDTVAAGDTFNGALAVALSRQQPMRDAIRYGTAAAAIAVTRPGAQGAIPYESDVESFLSRHTRGQTLDTNL